MKSEFDYKELFNQYAVETGRYLPRRKRQDIQMEIVSLLEDALEDISETAGQQPDEAMAFEVLRSFGPPITYADKYRQREYLVGPEIFPLFKPVLVFALALFLIQFVVGMALAINSGGFDLLGTVDKFFDGGFQMLGVLVLTFAIIERTTPESFLRWPFREMERTWEPKGLLANRKKKAVKVRDVWFELVFLGGFAIFLAFFPQWVGVGVNRDGVWGFVPTLSANYEIYQPWIVAYLLAKLIFNVVLARRSYWDNEMRWIGIGLRVVSIVLLSWMMFGPELFGINPAYLAMHNPPTSLRLFVESGLPEWNTGFNIYLIIQLVIQFALTVRDFFTVTRGKSELKLNLQ
ncbi:MAG: hypothetical protein ACK2T7_14615 [Anaerolineales bacterium]